jgi:hypothetical protein
VSAPTGGYDNSVAADHVIGVEPQPGRKSPRLVVLVVSDGHAR